MRCWRAPCATDGRQDVVRRRLAQPVCARVLGKVRRTELRERAPPTPQFAWRLPNRDRDKLLGPLGAHQEHDWTPAQHCNASSTSSHDNPSKSVSLSFLAAANPDHQVARRRARVQACTTAGHLDGHRLPRTSDNGGLVGVKAMARDLKNQ